MTGLGSEEPWSNRSAEWSSNRSAGTAALGHRPGCSSSGLPAALMTAGVVSLFAVDPAARLEAWAMFTGDCQSCSSTWRMAGRGKPSQKIVVACARELAGFVWAIATDQPPRTA
jgi:hypothetical protein